MAHADRLDRRSLLIAGLVGLVACFWAGGGPLNGDQAVYLYQAQQRLWFERWTHVGYVALLGALQSSARADGFNVLLGVLAILGIGAQSWRAALLVAGSVLPWMPFGEVDLLWFVLAVAAIQYPFFAALALLVSPTALAGLLWAGVHRRRAAVWALGAVVGLAALSWGAWGVGTRGVLQIHWRPAPLQQLWPLIVPLLLAAPTRKDLRELLLFSPVLLAPSDVPAMLLVVPWAAVRVAKHPLATGLLLVHLGFGLYGARTRHAKIQAEERLLDAATLLVHSGEAVDASWSLTVRLSLRLTGRPDALVRTTDPGFCAREIKQVWVLEPQPTRRPTRCP